jgi:hypothetical protein
MTVQNDGGDRVSLMPLCRLEALEKDQAAGWNSLDDRDDNDP